MKSAPCIGLSVPPRGQPNRSRLTTEHARKGEPSPVWQNAQVSLFFKTFACFGMPRTQQHRCNRSHPLGVRNHDAGPWFVGLPKHRAKNLSAAPAHANLFRWGRNSGPKVLLIPSTDRGKDIAHSPFLFALRSLEACMPASPLDRIRIGFWPLEVGQRSPSCMCTHPTSKPHPASTPPASTCMHEAQRACRMPALLSPDTPAHLQIFWRKLDRNEIFGGPAENPVHRTAAQHLRSEHDAIQGGAIHENVHGPCTPPPSTKIANR